MLEKLPPGDFRAEISVSFTFIHPETGCENDNQIETVTFRAINSSIAQVFAENSKPICNCGMDYQLQV
jgi:hypothetical protein